MTADLLDPTTGLPQLSEGQKWRVVRRSTDDGYYTHYYSPPEAAPTHELQIIGEDVIEDVKFVKRWGKQRKVVTERVGEVVIEQETISEQIKISYPHALQGHDADCIKYNKEQQAKYEADIAAAKKKIGKNATFVGHRATCHDYMDLGEQDFWVIDNTVNEKTILRTANEIIAGIAERERVMAENEEKKRKAEIELKEREARLNFWVGDYPPRVLLHDKKK